MTQTNFKLTVPPLSPTMRVEYLSTVMPIVGELPQFPNGLQKALKYIHLQWRLRVTELVEAGWQIASKKATYACNCPPCSALVEPWTVPCTLMICPFCFARRANHIYTKVRELLRSRRGMVLTFRRYRGFVDDYCAGIFFDRDGDLGTNINALLEAEKERVSAFRAMHLQDAIGGFYWYTIAPQVYDRPSDDGSCGRWLRRHGCVAVMPPKWAKHVEDAYLIRNPRDHTLAKLIGWIFRYQPGWLHSDAATMTTFLHAIKCKRFLSPFGYFKCRTNL